MTTLDAQFDEAELWREEALRLRGILLDCGLDEVRKWRQPCYLRDGHNICIVQRMTGFLSLLFFKGALMDDPDGVLESQGENTQSAKRIVFRSVAEVEAKEAAVRATVSRAVEAARLGLAAAPAPGIEPPDELVDAFDADPAYREAFEALTAGRQRSWLLHFTAAKQSATRAARIGRSRERVLAGKGQTER